MLAATEPQVIWQLRERVTDGGCSPVRPRRLRLMWLPVPQDTTSLASKLPPLIMDLGGGGGLVLHPRTQTPKNDGLTQNLAGENSKLNKAASTPYPPPPLRNRFIAEWCTLCIAEWCTSCSMPTARPHCWR